MKMGKRKESTNECDQTPDESVIQKKQRKPKPKKQVKTKDVSSEDIDVDVVDDIGIDDKPALKLKIKLANKSTYDENLSKMALNEPITDEDKKKLKKQTSSDAEDEEAWLEALETGKLDEFDEFKRMKDPALMTARQRALLEGKSHKNIYFPEPEVKAKEMTEDMIEKKALMARKRRQQVQAKREKDKKQTLERLLKKQEAKVKADRARSSKKGQMPRITYSYINNKDGFFYCIPDGYDFPMKPLGTPEIPVKQKCGILGCENFKKYNCSKTSIPLCSLDCYKKNLKNI